MNIFKKILFLNNDDKNPDSLIITRYQLSNLIALMLFLFFFTFMAGYYWGKKNIAQHLFEQLETDSLADKVSYAFYSMYDAQDNEGSSGSEDSESSKDIKSEAGIQYYGQLAGFGTQQAAQDYANKLFDNGFEVKMIPRRSKTTSGKVILWYQVVTPTFDDYQALVKCIDDIKKISKLRDVKIMEVAKQPTAES